MDDRIIGIVAESLPHILLAGLRYTVPLTLVTFAIGLAIAVLVAVARTWKTDSTSIGKGVSQALSVICRGYVWVFRGTPLMVQLFIVFFGLPHVGIRWDAIVCAVVVLSLNVGAYASETVRGAMEALPAGQYEAALSVGMSHGQAIRLVILPQALKASIPALSNTLISLVKDTSLVASITVAEMLLTTQRIVAVTYEPLVLYIEVALVYLAICTALSKVQQVLETRANTGGKQA